ncbi:MAG: hypothetical protein WCF65_09820 [Parachlamydiaceae bacterium]
MINPIDVIPPTILLNKGEEPPRLDKVQELYYLDIGNRILATVKAALYDLKTSSSKLFEELQEKVVITPLPPVIAGINKVCHQVERIFNIMSCLPALGILSGSVRTVLGKVQAISGLAVITISEVGRFVADKTTTNKELVKKWTVLSQFGLQHLVHGTLNVLRGTAEMLVGSYTGGLGNIPLFIPNIINGRNFTPYYDYPKKSGIQESPKIEDAAI